MPLLIGPKPDWMVSVKCGLEILARLSSEAVCTEALSLGLMRGCSCYCLRSSSGLLMSFSQVMWCSAPAVTVSVCVSVLSCPCCSPRSAIRCGTWCTFTPSATTSTCVWCISTSWAVTWPFGRGTSSRPFWRTSSPITPTYPSSDATMCSRVSACQKHIY